MAAVDVKGRGRSRHSSAETAAHVLEVAHELFYWHGIRATGVDRVAAEAGIAPTTLYRLFASKDDLVAAYLRRNDAGYRAWLTHASSTGTPRQKILAVFDALEEQVQPGQCRGCPFLMALAEYPDPDCEPHRVAVATKGWVRARLGELTRELAGVRRVRNPEVLADQLALLVEGVYGSVQALGAGGPARNARSTAATLIRAAG